MATAAGNPAATGLPSLDTGALGESDDFVEYWLHLELDDGELAGTELRSTLQARSALCMDFARQWTQGYIWQRDPFVLVPCPATGADGKPTACLYGRTYWGENIDDEWFIVWLLLQMTKTRTGSMAQTPPRTAMQQMFPAC
jgi:hypothetical protein